MARNTFSRSLHDVGLAAWFGGTLANATALNPAAAEAGDTASAGNVTNEGWDRWTPVNAVAIGAHVIGGLGIILANKKRISGQQGVATMTGVKTAATAAALGATAYSRVLGRRVSRYDSVPVVSGTQPANATPSDAADAQRQLRILQWAIPALTGTVLVINAFAGEQQRASEVGVGALKRLVPGR